MSRKYSRRGAPLAEKLDFYIDKSGGPDACWPWTASTDDWGYGTLRYQGKVQKAHRLMWRDTRGPIPVGLLVLHRCDNPPFCNPAHLWLGTDADNAADKTAKGRGNQPKGEASGTAKLTWEQARAVRVATGSHREIAEQFDIAPSNVSMIKRGQTWKEA